MAEDYELYASTMYPEDTPPDEMLSYADSREVPPASGPVTSRRYAMQALTILGEQADTEQAEFLASMPTPKSVAFEYASMREMELERSFRATVGDLIAKSPTAFAVEETLRLARGQQEELNARRDSPTKVEDHYVERTVQEVQRNILRHQASLVAAGNDIAELTEEQGMLDTIGNFVGYIFPFGEDIDIANIDDSIRENPELAEIAGADLETIAARLNALPPERFEAIWPALRDAVIDATKGTIYGGDEGNLLKAQDYLLTLLGTGGAGELRQTQLADRALGVADILGIGAVRRGAKLAAMAATTGAQKVVAHRILKNAAGLLDKKTAPSRVAAGAGDIGSAADHTIAALTDSTYAARMGIDTLEAALDVVTYSRGWVPGTIDSADMGAEFSVRMEDYIREAAGWARSLTDETDDLLMQGALTPHARRQVQETWLEKMTGSVKESYLAQNIALENVRITKQTREGFEFEYTTTSTTPPPQGKPRLRLHTGKVEFKLNTETGTFQATVHDRTGQQFGKVLSPSTASIRTEEGDFHLAVDQASSAERVEALIMSQTAKLLKDVFAPLRSANPAKLVPNIISRKKVENALLAGDEYIDQATQIPGKVFTPTELQSGMNGLFEPLTKPGEIESYYRYRAVSDAMQKVGDYKLIRELQLGGFKDVNLAPDLPGNTPQNVWKEFQVFGRPLGRLQDARASLQEHAGAKMYNPTTKQAEVVTDEVLEEMYQQGEVLVRLKSPWNPTGKGDLDLRPERVRYARVKQSSLYEVGARRPALPYRTGYAPKANIGEYAVKVVQNINVAGFDTVNQTSAMRLFNSLADAKKFRQQLLDKEIAKLTKGKREPTQAELDALARKFPEPDAVHGQTLADRVEETAGRHGGLFEGTRSADDVLFGLDGRIADRVPPMQLLARQAAHLASGVARNELRIGVEKRWMNTVRNEFPHIKVTGFDSAPLPTNTPAGKRLEDLRQQIKAWNMVPTNEENYIQTLIQRMHDWALYGAQGRFSQITGGFVPDAPFGFKNKESVKSLLWLKHSNPLTAIKAANMHVMLGVLNPRQIIMQASAAAVAFSKFPQHAPGAFKDTFYFAFLDNIRNDTALGKVFKMLAKEGEIDAGLAEAYRAYRRTGLYESVYQNADLAKVATDGLGVGAQALRGMEQTSLLLYHTAEQFNRRFTFLTEFREWSKRTGKTTPTDDELEFIMAEAAKNMLSLQAANKAWWQGGAGTSVTRQLLGTATQFMQVPAKTMELVFKGEKRGGFTPAQRARIAGMQLGLFGIAAIPFGAQLADLYAYGHQLATGEPLTVDPAVAETITQGMTGLVVNELLGGDLDIASHISPSGGAQELVKDLITSEEPMWKKMAGASFTTLDRTMTMLQELSAMSFRNRTGELVLSPAHIKMALHTIMQVPSSYRNATKFYIMRNYHQILQKSGREIVAQDFDTVTEIGALFGFTPRVEDDAFALSNHNFTQEELIRDMVDMKVRMLTRAQQMGYSPEEMEQLEIAMQVMDSAMSDYVPMEVKRRADERMFGPKPKSKLDEELHKYFNTTAPQRLHENMILDSQGIGSPALSQPLQRQQQLDETRR